MVPGLAACARAVGELDLERRLLASPSVEPLRDSEPLDALVEALEQP